ncbi:MAG: 5'-nucleotidase C-terminal domain-containing protein [Clostridia bacterium]|nr:5'-nucleotidase C-terminal domain-containing protein [Clostridia bacterium]
MKRALALILSLVMVLCLIPAMAFATDEVKAPNTTVEIKLLGTSDIHGQLFATDYTVDSSQSGTYRRGLTRLATYVEEQRDLYSNVLLFDTGDLVQGTPLTYYYAFNRGDVEDPAMKALRVMGYDLFVPGNHEFNYGMTILQRQLDYLTSPSTAATRYEPAESQVAVSAANYLAAATNNDDSKDWATWNDYDPYVIYNCGGVRVAVMGIGNPNVAKWDVPENWEGIYFANPIETYLHYEAELEAAADIIVIASHSGINSDADSDYMERLIQQTDSIDVIFAGHEHFNRVTEIANANGDIVPVISPYTKCRAIGDCLITYDRATGEVTVDAKVVSTESLELYQPLVDVLQPYETETWENYMNIELGTATAAFSALNLGTAPSAFMDLINKVQIWGTYDKTGYTATTADDTPAQLSISAPLTSGDATELIPEGEILLGDMFRLYRYENWFYQITMSGKEIRTWLEFAATKIQVDSEGNPYVTSGDLTYYDVIYGDGFSYVIDYTAPEGQRVGRMTYMGQDVPDDAEFTVVVNNYRYNGGGNYVAYLNENGCDFVANDESRIIFSTQYDMEQGEDKGQARNLLADYIVEQGEISPVITSTWRLTAGYDFEIYGDIATTNELESDEDGNVLWNVNLADMAEGINISSLDFELTWDNTQLQLVDVIIPTMKINHPLNGVRNASAPEINTNATVSTDLSTATELYYAFASSYGAWLDEGDDILTLKFKIVEGVAENTVIPVEFADANAAFVNSNEEPVDMINMNVGYVDGSITVVTAPTPPPVEDVDKSALQALYDADKALYDAATITNDWQSLPVGTSYLTVAEGQIDAAALAADLAVLEDTDGTQEEVDAAYAALLATFIAPHQTGVDKSALQALYNTDKALYDAATITDDLGNVVDGTLILSVANGTIDANALAAALAVLNDATANQAQVNAAFAALQNDFIAPTAHVVDTARLEAAIAYAQEFMASDEFKDCSDALQAEWEQALADALAELADPGKTNNSCNEAADAIYALDKTGESALYIVFAGIAVLAMLGMAVAVRRRFN